jgi:serine/threonine protein kinase
MTSQPVPQPDAPALASFSSGEQALSLVNTDHDPCDELAHGQIVADKYRVKAVLGRGGFAVVYDAEHVALRRSVALKVLHRSQGTPHTLIERFAREVRISALVRHPNVLEVYDAGVLADGSPFLVMEKISGLTLYEKLCMEQRLGVEECVNLLGQLLDALEALAARGIVHRDIKPENLMLSRGPSGEIKLKLVDFGIALVRDERIEPRLTMQGTLVGTPHYMAPEQLRCELMDQRVDLYATGVVMYQILTGHLPYEGGTLSALTTNVLRGKAHAITELRPDCPQQFAHIIERALAREPEQRFASASEMQAALAAFRDPPRGSLSADAPLGRVLRRVRRPRELAIAVGLLALGVLLPEQVSFASALRSAFPQTFGGSAGLAEAKADLAVSQPALATLGPLPESEATSPLPTRAHANAGDAPRAMPVRPSASLSTALSERAASAPPVRVHARTVSDESTARGVDAGKAHALVRRGLTLYLHGEIDAAYALYRQASLSAPREAPAFRGLGLCASRLGRRAEAVQAFARYLELASDAADAHLIRARLAGLRAEP